MSVWTGGSLWSPNRRAPFLPSLLPKVHIECHWRGGVIASASGHAPKQNCDTPPKGEGSAITGIRACNDGEVLQTIRIGAVTRALQSSPRRSEGSPGPSQWALVGQAPFRPKPSIPSRHSCRALSPPRHLSKKIEGDRAQSAFRSTGISQAEGHALDSIDSKAAYARESVSEAPRPMLMPGSQSGCRPDGA